MQTLIGLQWRILIRIVVFQWQCGKHHDGLCYHSYKRAYFAEAFWQGVVNGSSRNSAYYALGVKTPFLLYTLLFIYAFRITQMQRLYQLRKTACESIVCRMKCRAQTTAEVVTSFRLAMAVYGCVHRVFTVCCLFSLIVLHHVSQISNSPTPSTSFQ